MLIYVALCDDASDNFYLFEEYFKKFSAEYGIMFKFKHIKKQEELIYLYRDITYNPLHLIILKIGNSGEFDLNIANSIRRCSARDIRLIFFSDHVELNWILNSIDAQPIQYWIKPISYIFFSNKMLSICKNVLTAESKLLCIQNKNDHFVINKSSIISIQKEKHSVVQNLLYVVTDSGNYIVTNTLNNILDKLGGLPFLIIYRSIIINILKISKFNTKLVTMENGHSFPIGRTYLKDLKNAYIVLQN